MKIEILSMQEVNNYGSFLQAYALQNLVKNQSNSYDEISFGIPYYFTENKTKVYKFVEKLKRIKNFRINKIAPRYHSYKLSKVLSDSRSKYFEKSDNKCDLLIVGSDEVFNFTQKAPWDEMSFLGKYIEHECMITYAASCGNTIYNEIREDKLEAIEAGIKKFQNISVRDKGTANLVKALGISKITEHLDPVLIYDFSKEMKNNPVKDGCRPYMIIYSYTQRFNNKEEIEKIKTFARINKLELISVEGYQTWTDKHVTVSPLQLFDLFDKAEYIITDTFHGTILSAKMHKKFTVFIRESNKNKITDLVEKLSLNEHVYNGNLEDSMTYNEYEAFETMVETERKHSNEYISYSINNRRKNGID